MYNMDMQRYKANRYFLYLRRSQDAEDRQVASLDDQEAEMRHVAKRLDLNVVEVIQESQSAKKPGRPKFNEMIARFHSGEADGILCWKINRLARNPVDGGQISWLLQQNVIKHIQTYSGEYLPTDNVLMMAVELGMANQFVKDLSVDVRRGLRKKAERGWNAQRSLPIGYKHFKGYEKGDAEIISTPDLKIVQRIFQTMLKGSYSASDIHRLAQQYGLVNKKGKEYGLNTIFNTLTSEFYCGYYYWKDGDGKEVRYKGQHEAILTEDEFNEVQRLLGKKGRPTRVNKLDFAFRGPILCGECGCAITAEHKTRCICSNCKYKFSCKVRTECPKCKTDLSEMKKPKMYHNVYYHCTKKSKVMKCKQSVIDESELKKLIFAELDKVEISEDFYHWAVEGVKYMHGGEVETQDEVVSRLQEKADGLRSLDSINSLL
jgi:site-specific DNA recombinase